MPLNRILYLSLVILISTSTQIFAENLVLFKNGAFVEDYNDKIQGMKAGDILHFSNDKQFLVLDILGDLDEHFMSFVVQVPDNKVLRLARMRMDFKAPADPETAARKKGFWTQLLDAISMKYPQVDEDSRSSDIFLKHMWGYLKGSKFLRKQGVPMPMVFENESQMPEYILVQEVPVIFTFEGLDHKLPLEEDEMKLVKEEFLKFAEKTWSLSQIGDFDPGQLGWTGKEWLLLDAAEGSLKWKVGSHSDKTAFDEFKMRRLDLKAWVEEARSKILERRSKESRASCAAALAISSPTIHSGTFE